MSASQSSSSRSSLSALARLSQELADSLSKSRATEPFAVKAWSALKVSVRAAALEAPAMSEASQSSLAAFCHAFEKLTADLSYDSAWEMGEACERLEREAGEGALKPARVAARALREALEEGAQDESKITAEEWEAFVSGGDRALSRLCLALASAGDLPQDLTNFCACEADDWLTGESLLDEEKEDSEDGFMLSDAPSAMTLMTLGAEGGIWPESVVDPETDHLCAKRMSWAFQAFDAGMQADHDQKVEPEARDLDPCLRLAERLGAAAVKEEGGQEMLLEFAGRLTRWFGGQEDSEPGAFRARDLGYGVFASNLLAGAFVFGAIKERPELALRRNERGHTPLSLFNEALSTAVGGKDELASAQGWVSGTFQISEQTLCEMLKVSADPMALVALPNPAAMAASPKVRAAAEALALEEPTKRRSILSGRGRGSPSL